MAEVAVRGEEEKGEYVRMRCEVWWFSCGYVAESINPIKPSL